MQPFVDRCPGDGGRTPEGRGPSTGAGPVMTSPNCCPGPAAAVERSPPRTGPPPTMSTRRWSAPAVNFGGEEVSPAPYRSWTAGTTWSYPEELPPRVDRRCSAGRGGDGRCRGGVAGKCLSSDQGPGATGQLAAADRTVCGQRMRYKPSWEITLRRPAHPWYPGTGPGVRRAGGRSANRCRRDRSGIGNSLSRCPGGTGRDRTRHD